MTNWGAAGPTSSAWSSAASLSRRERSPAGPLSIWRRKDSTARRSAGLQDGTRGREVEGDRVAEGGQPRGLDPDELDQGVAPISRLSEPGQGGLERCGITSRARLGDRLLELVVLRFEAAPLPLLLGRETVQEDEVALCEDGQECARPGTFEGVKGLLRETLLQEEVDVVAVGGERESTGARASFVGAPQPAALAVESVHRAPRKLRRLVESTFRAPEFPEGVKRLRLVPRPRGQPGPNRQGAGEEQVCAGPIASALGEVPQELLSQGRLRAIRGQVVQQGQGTSGESFRLHSLAQLRQEPRPLCECLSELDAVGHQAFQKCQGALRRPFGPAPIAGFLDHGGQAFQGGRHVDAVWVDGLGEDE